MYYDTLLWTDRHDGLQCALMRAMWFARVTARAVGTRDYFGSANPPLKKLRADIVCMHYYGMGRHLFVDVAVTEPATQRMVGGARSSATEAGVAAEVRTQKKYGKYCEACARIDSTFRDAVIERYGHCSDGLASSNRHDQTNVSALRKMGGWLSCGVVALLLCS